MQALFLCNTWDLSSLCACGHISCVRLFVMLWTVALQTPLSMGFSRQEYWSGLPQPPPGNPINPVTEPESPASPALQVDSLSSEPHFKHTAKIYRL